MTEYWSFIGRLLAVFVALFGAVIVGFWVVLFVLA